MQVNIPYMDPLGVNKTPVSHVGSEPSCGHGC